MARPFVPIIHGASLARPDEADTVVAAGLISEALNRLGYASETIALGLDLSVLETMAARAPYAVFNLVESLKGDAALSYLAPAALDHLKLAYTGAQTAPYFITLSKLLTKDALRAHDLPTAPSWPDGRGVPPDARVIIKSALEHASVGLDTGSVVTGALAAREIAAREARFGGRFFAETFIEGREFTLSLIETADGIEIFPIHELDFTRLPASRLTIIDYSAKWDTTNPAYGLWEYPKFGLETDEPELAARLEALARAAWVALGLNGYARVDFRIDVQGTPFILEINVNPCLTRDGGFVRAAAQAGYSFDAVIAAIIAGARAQIRAAA